VEIVPPTDRPLRRPSITLKLNSSSVISDIQIVNIDRFSENIKNSTSGIVNVEWSDEWYNTADRYVIKAETSRLQGDVDLAEYFVGNISNITKHNLLVARLNVINVIADLSHLVDFSRNSSTFWSALPYNDIHDFTLASVDNVLRDVTGSDNGIRFSFLTLQPVRYYTDAVIEGIHPNLATKDGVRVDIGVDGLFKIHGLTDGKTYTLKVYGYKLYTSGTVPLMDARVYNNNGYDTTLRYDPSNNLTTTVDFVTVPAYNSELYLGIHAVNATSTQMSAIEIIEHN
jgi:hypothetical protein